VPKKTILQQEIESRCRLCKEYEETIDHLISGCPTLAKNKYIIRHDKVCTHLHYSICNKLGIETAENWFSHIRKTVTEHEDITVLWNQGIRLQADREILTNRPDIIVKNKKEKPCLLIDVAIPSNKNAIQKEVEKKLKYRNSENVEHEMLCHTSNHWGHRNYKRKFTKISGNNTRTTINRFPTKTAILGTSHIIRKVLQTET
jgi:hypothetical protein